ERRRIAAAERRRDRFLRKRSAFAIAVQVARNLVGPAAAGTRAPARVFRARGGLPRRCAVLVLTLRLQAGRFGVHRCLHYIRVDECSRPCYICQGEYMTTRLTDVETLFKALADATRLRILALLVGGEICVCEIHAALKLPQPTVSRHLAYLRRS